MDDAAERIEQTEKACARAEEVETTLTTFAEQLADKADAVQERMAVLMATVETSENAHQRLEAVTREAVAIRDETAAKTATAQERLEQVVTRAEEQHRHFTEQALADHENRLRELIQPMVAQAAERVRSECSDSLHQHTQIVDGRAACVHLRTRTHGGQPPRDR